MASATLSSVAGTFPVGTSVAAYRASDFPTWWSGGALPSGISSVTSATVASDGSLAFTGLTQGVAYKAYASLSGTPTYVGFSAKDAVGTSANPEVDSPDPTTVQLVDRSAATATDVGAGGAAVAAGAAKLWGLTLRETTGTTAAVVRLRDGVVGGRILATISLNASESVRELWAKPAPVGNAAGVYVQLVSGTIPEGTVFTS